MSTLPTDKAEDTAIDAEAAREFVSHLDSLVKKNERIYAAALEDFRGHAAPRPTIKSTAEGEHYLRHFTKLAKVNAAANAALDTARREWAKRGEG